MSRRFAGRIPPAEMWPAHDSRFTHRWVELPSGDQLRVIECRGAAPAGLPVVLIPGWGSPAYVFRELLPDLAANGYRPVAVEPRGQGLSTKPRESGAYSTEALAAHFAELLDALGFEQCVLGGHSLGAAHAARTAMRQPERVRALILMSPVGTHGQPRRLLVSLIPHRLARPIAPWLARRWAVKLILRLAAARSDVYTRRDVDEYWAPTQFPELARSALDLFRELDWGEDRPVRADDITVPTLLIYGARDPLVRRTRVVEELTLSPLVTESRLERVGHIITDEAPRETARAVIAFLRAL